MVDVGERLKFELGRHETFPLREGWLSKGLRRLVDDGKYRPDVETADSLGLGSRMARSLAFWLEATGFASSPASRGQPILPNPMSRSVSAADAFFEYPATMWFAHLSLARRRGSVWNWFFNDFRTPVFTREACTEAFFREVRDRGRNPTTPGVAQREVGCLLATYAMPGPGERTDPEDLSVSPFHALGIVVRHRDTGRYQRRPSADPVPVEVFLACVDLLCAEGVREIPLGDLVSLRDSPGRLLNMDGDAVAEAAFMAAHAYRGSGVSVSLHGTVRTLVLPDRRASPEDWLHAHFTRLETRNDD